LESADRSAGVEFKLLPQFGEVFGPEASGDRGRGNFSPIILLVVGKDEDKFPIGEGGGNTIGGPSEERRDFTLAFLHLGNGGLPEAEQGGEVGLGQPKFTPPFGQLHGVRDHTGERSLVWVKSSSDIF
jgi:hypothetical protein